MSNVLVMPDAHLHLDLLHTISRLISPTSPDYIPVDKVVSLGDWCDDWDAPFSAYQAFFSEFRDLIAHSPIPFVLCWGNHDYGYFANKSFTGKHPNVQGVKDLLSSLPIPPKDFLPYYQEDSILFSHAGFSAKSSTLLFTNHPMSELDLWDDDSCLWGRPTNTSSDTFSPAFLQVVGHTPMRTAVHVPDVNILYTDTWSDYRDHTPFGDHTLATVDTENQSIIIIQPPREEENI